MCDVARERQGRPQPPWTTTLRVGEPEQRGAASQQHDAQPAWKPSPASTPARVAGRARCPSAPGRTPPRGAPSPGRRASRGTAPAGRSSRRRTSRARAVSDWAPARRAARTPTGDQQPDREADQRRASVTRDQERDYGQRRGRVAQVEEQGPDQRRRDPAGEQVVRRPAEVAGEEPAEEAHRAGRGRSRRPRCGSARRGRRWCRHSRSRRS